MFVMCPSYVRRGRVSLFASWSADSGEEKGSKSNHDQCEAQDKHCRFREKG